MSPTLTPGEGLSLLRCPLLVDDDGSLSDALTQEGGSVLVQVSTGRPLYTPQRFQRCLGILLSGSLRVTKDALAVSMLAPGDLFGAAALYSDAPDYAVTLTGRKAGRALLIEQGRLDELMGIFPLLRENYLRYLTGRIRFLNGRLHSLAAGDAEGKLARYLLSDQSVLSSSATDMASRLGVSRATLYRAFHALESQGLITRSHGLIQISDRDGLSAYA